MSITSSPEVAQYYQDEKIAERYIRQRFTDPINRWEHQRQVQILNKIIHEFQPKRILEFAPGPARITTELEREGGTSIDSSKEMLELARKRMAARGKKWTFQQGNIFHLRLNQKVHLIFCFRFLLHFQEKEREEIYRQAARALQPQGLLVFEVMNAGVIRPLRSLLGKKRYVLHDELYSDTKFRAEMEKNGFTVLRLYPVLSHFWLQVACSRPFLWVGWSRMAIQIIRFWEQASGNPYEWVAVCQKKPSQKTSL